ncbi:hypothetical protein RB628_16340 [Streptomyces sp. ADMS]|uniref:hypothetical protein n=1 Tax=Streptomyces sp. ADMS TaxID=3071415 RepID=UPI00296E5BAE|nr:hypothetical protein [Streptomyces sp. ADMS]MDW4906869.1 hypothetical protein [Streptomyces sp. ADMS]
MATVREVRVLLAAPGVRRIPLSHARCAHGVYEEAGFRPLDKPVQWMAPHFE